MKEALSNLSTRMIAVMPDPARMAPYASLLPGLTIIAPAEGEQKIVDAMRCADAKILLLISRPPLDIGNLVGAVRTDPATADCYIVVIIPVDESAPATLDYDIDDIIVLNNNDIDSQTFATTLLRYQRNQDLRSKFISATRTALNAMDSASEYGALIHFFDASETAHSPAELADLIQLHLAGKGLDVCFCLDMENQTVCRPATQSGPRHALLHHLKSAGRRMVSTDRLLGFHFTHFTLLVSNCPTENPEKYGHLKDALAHFGAIVESRVRALMIRERTQKQQRQVLDIMQLIRRKTEESNERTKTIMRRLLSEIELAATTFDMNYQEEQKLLEVVNHATESLEQVRENDDLIEQHFLNLIAAITSVIELIESTSAPVNAADSVELF